MESLQAAARNYGSVGAICGHEMTHGFDDVGSEYDGDGNRNGWWSPAVVAAFKVCAKDLIPEPDILKSTPMSTLCPAIF